MDAIDNITLEFEEVVEDSCRLVAFFQLKAENPLTDVPLLASFQLIDLTVKVDQLLIVLDDGFKRVRVVVDAPITQQHRQVGVLYLITDTSGLPLVLHDRLFKEDLK